jgi:hypothetical protein
VLAGAKSRPNPSGRYACFTHDHKLTVRKALTAVDPVRVGESGGLSVSTFITLLVIPALYLLLERRASQRHHPSP